MSTISTLADNYRIQHAILDENPLEPQIATFARALVNTSNEMSLDASDLPSFSDSGDAVILTAGAYTATFTFTATTGLTFPTTGTLATRAGAETLTNKTLTSVLITTSIAPSSNDGAPLGNTGAQFSDLFLASGGVINLANGDVALTHSSGILTMGTGELRITTVGTNAASVPTLGSTSTLTNKTLTAPVLTSGTVTTKLSPTTDDGAPLGDTTHNFSDLFLASGAVLNYANGNVALTHSSGILTLGTGEFRITTVGTNAASVGTLGSTSTLTNKTLTAPVITTPTVTDLAEIVAATNVIAGSESGTTFYLASATEFVSTLPAPALGLRFRFWVSAAPSGADYTIVTTSGTDLIHGSAVDAAGTAADSTAGTAADTITFVGGVALKGDYVEVESDGVSWYARGVSSAAAAITFTQS